jgi:DNA-binding transcriptional ArsR family regulator
MTTPAYELQARSFKALSHPSRIAMIEMMRNGPICSCEIEPKLGLSQSNVAKHLAILRDSGLVSSNRDGSRVMCEVTDPRIFAAIDAIRAATQARLVAVTQSFADTEPEPVDELQSADRG